jgi:hypothetical protein
MRTVIESLCYLEVGLKTTKNGLWYVVVAHLPHSLTKLNDFCVIGPTNWRATKCSLSIQNKGATEEEDAHSLLEFF